MKGGAMNVLVAGATGVLGRQLVPLLVAAGHEVVGMMRSASKRDALRTLGATPVVADALDPEQVARAVDEASPDAIIHQLTALSGGLNMRRFDCTFAATNRLRTEGTDHLLAAVAVGADLKAGTPPAHRRHRPSPRCRPRCRRAPLSRPELRRLALCAHRWPNQGRGITVRPTPARSPAHQPRRHPPPGGGAH